ncbi:MAG: prepilin-type N-terminal cleavage/methylation domain-containing protein [Desulfobacterales bacterium]|nr:prepilin-type N-terminal cleavage/methylation domain-containing protein [Desulfobacterales bacterium]
MPTPKDNKGFTLIEMLIAMAVASIVMTAIYSAFDSQQRTHTTQQQVVDMQQNIRSALYLMGREIRMTGYDPIVSDGIDNDSDGSIDEAGETSGATILVASPNMIRFTLDIDNDGNPIPRNPDGDTNDLDEDISFGFSNVDDADDDGIADTGAAMLLRTTGGVPSTIADNIHAVGFAYAFDDDGDGELDTAGGNVIWAVDSDGDGLLDTSIDTNNDGMIDANDTSGGSALGTLVNINNIRSVKVWVLGRTEARIRGYSNIRTYIVGDKKITTSGDESGYQHSLLTTMINCRNMGI